MEKLTLFVVILVFGATLAMPHLNKELDTEWEAYKTTYKKSYQPHEENTRRRVWEENVRRIRIHNLEADRGVHTFTLGMNEYGDMTSKEFSKVMNGYRMRNITEVKTEFHQSLVDISDLPDTVDWREKGYVTEVKNQKQCGSCWAFSTTGSLEGQHFKSTGKLVSLSEQNLVDCSKKQGNHGCEGGLMTQAFRYIEANKGIDTEESYPYEAKNGKCRFKQENVGATDSGYKDVSIFFHSEEALQKAVAEVGPISVAIDASLSSFQLYKSGVYSDILCSTSRLDHGVLAVGYGTYDSKPYWLVKNSWGESWGIKGYIMMARNNHNMCGIATQASYPKV